MSLHQLAQEIQSRGRGEDTVLIHMTPKEVGGLQSLAMKHGGSLTINPETGLPEAGFLKNILPTLLGVGLSFIPGVGPLMAAGLVGGGTALATGSLEKGLMAGLGAYGGAGMGSGLASLGGAGAKAAAAAPSIIPNAATPLSQAINTAGAANAGMAAPAMSMAAGANPVASMFAPPLTAANQAISIAQPAATIGSNFAAAGRGLQAATSGGFEGLKAAQAAIGAQAPYATALTGASLLTGLQRDPASPEKQKSLIRPYEFSRTQNPQAYAGSAPAYGQPFDSSERNYFTDQFTALKPYEAPGPEYKAADGGLMSLNAFAVGGPVEQMSAQNAVGANHTYPQSQIETSMYANPMVQRPIANNVVTSGVDAPVDPYTGEARFAKGGRTTGEYKYDYNPQTQQFAQTAAPKPKPTGFLSPLMAEISARTNVYGGGGFRETQQAQKQNEIPAAPVVAGGIAPQAQQPMYQPQQAAPIPAYQSPEQQLGLTDFYSNMNQQLANMRQQGYAAGGGVSSLGDYSDGGRLLKGPGDGVSDSIPAVIGNRQPARLADGEFVIPARIVSELGNGSTDAGAKKLYAMMERIQSARKKSIGKGKVAANTRSERLLPA